MNPIRRNALTMLLGATATLAASPTLALPHKRKEESRLIGTWRSDKEKTLTLWKYKKEISPEARERFEKIFGKFTLRFTATHIFTEFDEINDIVPYSVIAKDKTSVVIAWHEKEETSLQHIHFEENSYYVLSGYNIEFYSRVPA